ncbi:hypothetical protein ACS0TY_014467 [Phlomoides rotata]
MHLNVPEEKIPKIGIEFGSEVDAYNFYNEYAKAAGFDIRKNTVLIKIKMKEYSIGYFVVNVKDID